MKAAQLNKFLKVQQAFTLVELLVVIAVLAVLAAAVLVAINPVEQINRGKDATRVSAMAQLGHALQTYATNNSSLANIYPPVAGGAGCAVAGSLNWMDCL